MMKTRGFSALTAVALICGWVTTAAIPTAVEASTPLTIASHLTLDNDGTVVAAYPAPCTVKHGCDNGLRLLWAKGPCYDQRTYPPIAVGWFYKSVPTAKYWPIASPCGSGIRLQWNTGGTLMYPNWVNAPLSNQDLVRFPSHSNGATVYSYGGHNTLTAQWLMNGKITSTITLPAADDAVWSSFTGTPPAPTTTPATPSVLLWGRTGSFTDATSTTQAPPGSNGIQFAWYLSLSQEGLGRERGCRLVNGTYWTDPPVMFEYTTQGKLDGRLQLLPCPTDSGGNPLDFNMINFGWTANSTHTGYVLDNASGSLNNNPVDGTNPNWMPQPPATADGLYFESDLDDFQSAYWLNGSSYEGGAIKHPEHVRMETWTG
jgi:hypothetical protein